MGRSGKYTQAMFEQAAQDILDKARNDKQTEVIISVGHLLCAVIKKGDNPPTPSARSALDNVAAENPPTEIVYEGVGGSGNSKERKIKFCLVKKD